MNFFSGGNTQIYYVFNKVSYTLNMDSKSCKIATPYMELNKEIGLEL